MDSGIFKRLSLKCWLGLGVFLLTVYVTFSTLKFELVPMAVGNNGVTLIKPGRITAKALLSPYKLGVAGSSLILFVAFMALGFIVLALANKPENHGPLTSKLAKKLMVISFGAHLCAAAFAGLLAVLAQ